MDSPAGQALPRLRSTRPERVDASAARPKAAAQDGPRNPTLASILQNKKADIESALSFCGGERGIPLRAGRCRAFESRSEEHTSELQSLMRISYAVFCMQKK